MTELMDALWEDGVNTPEALGKELTRRFPGRITPKLLAQVWANGSNTDPDVQVVWSELLRNATEAPQEAASVGSITTPIMDSEATGQPPAGLASDDQRILLGKLTWQERKGLRAAEPWETCFQAWLDSARPSAIREWLAGDRETFLRWMDSQTVAFLLATEVHGQDEVEALKDLFPMWETPEMEDEEIEAETPLKQEERKAAMDLLVSLE